MALKSRGRSLGDLTPPAQSRQEDWPSLGLVFAVSLAQTLESVTGEKFQLKWPNDIWYREAKLAGILMEPIHEGSALALGFGINYTTPQAVKDAPLRHPAVGLDATTGDVPKPQKLLELIRENLSAPYNGWNLGQWESSRQAFEERDFLRDTPIRWRDNGEQSEGIGRGIDERGRLRVEMSRWRTQLLERRRSRSNFEDLILRFL